MNVDEEDRYPWLREEKECLQGAIAAGTSNYDRDVYDLGAAEAGERVRARLTVHTGSDVVLGLYDEHQRLITMIDQTSAANGSGSVPGVIDNVAIANPIDDDTFTFLAPADALSTISVTPLGASPTLTARLQVLNAQGLLIDEVIAASPEPISINVRVDKGERYFVVISGEEFQSVQTEGEYLLEVNGIPFVDDYADIAKWFQVAGSPSDILKDEYDWRGFATRIGEIESPADTDV
ncbi:MAG: hypothetical protein HC918_13960, partial [Oscillatoriales cyanobacterium SM2_1_8]|nr:hypothetical protein [Oscillatoriales cyanobacterium SM2_1_8]